MNEGKFTPGPWETGEHQNQSNWYEISVTSPSQMCEVATARGAINAMCDHMAGASQLKANANLIAAAPDLYEALIEAKRQLEECEQEITGECYNSPQINAALARARGYQP